MNKEYRTIYKVDSSKNMRVWHMEQDGDKYRVHSGVEGGKIVISGWKIGEPKNIGKANETTGETQTTSEIEAKYKFQLYQSGYYETREEALKAKPAFFKVMTAHKWNDRKDKVEFPVYSQPKLDGIRCVATINGLQSRGGKELVGTPHIHEELDVIFEKYPDIVIDGELYNHKFKDNFNEIQSIITKKTPNEEDLRISFDFAEFHVYDIAGSGTFEERFIMQNDVLDMLRPIDCIEIVRTDFAKNSEELDNYYGEYLSDGYEGQMVRINEYEYKKSRSNGLLKRKEFEDAEFTIVSIEEGKGNWKGKAKKVYIKLEDGSIQGAGLRGSFDFTQMLLQERDEYVGGTVTIRYQNRTPDGKLRFPIAIKFYDGERDY